MLEICFKYTLGMLDVWCKYAGLLAYLIAMLLSKMHPLDLPVSLVASGVTLLSLVKYPVLNYLFNWILFSLLVYMLITYHEHDGCLLEKCHQSEASALIAVVATIVVWTTIPSYKKRKKPEPIPVAKEVLPIKIDPPKKTTPKAPTFPKLQWV
jgi:hypothetical protein